MASNFPADTVPQAAEDPLFGLMAAYRKDEFDKKVDLGIGAYRDDNAKPWILPVVKRVSIFDSQACRILADYVRPMTSYIAIQTLITNTFLSPDWQTSHSHHNV